MSPGLRTRLEHLVDEVDCSVCGGSRLRDDAAAVRLRGRTIDEICRLPLGKLLAEFQAWKLDEHRAEDRRRAGPRDPQSAAVPGRRGAGVPDAGPAGPHAFRRRDAADPPGRAGGQRTVRRALRARRADDRPAPPRQPPAAGRPAEAPRPGQHAAGGRARSRGDRATPTSCSISVPAAGRQGGQIVARGTPAAGRQAPRLGHRSVSHRQEGDSRPGRTAGCRRGSPSPAADE